MRISDWSSDVCSADLEQADRHSTLHARAAQDRRCRQSEEEVGHVENRWNQEPLDIAQRESELDEGDQRSVEPCHKPEHEEHEGKKHDRHSRRGSVSCSGGRGDGGCTVDHIGYSLFAAAPTRKAPQAIRTEEHTSEIQSLMRNSYA